MNIFKCLILLVAITYCSFSRAEKPPFTLKGTIVGLKNGKVYLRWSANNKIVVDSATITNGAFRLQGVISEPVVGFLSVSEEGNNSQERKEYARLFLEPADMNVKVTYGDMEAAKMSGSVSQLEMDAYNQKRQQVEKHWKVVMDTLTAVNNRSNFEYQALKDWVLQPYFEEMEEINAEYIRKHPSSWFTGWLVMTQVWSLPADSLKHIYAKWSLQMKKSSYGEAILTELKKRTIGVPGAIAGTFSAKDIDQQPIALTDYKGKNYVLLDFWASWCLPCRKESPHLKELYARYKDKGLVVIGVGDDDRTSDAWKEAIAKDGLPWRNILDGKKWLPEGRYDMSQAVSEKYNITELPTQILIDPDGKVIGRFHEEDFAHGDLDKQLAGIWKDVR